MKTIKFNFVDGEKEINIGYECYISGRKRHRNTDRAIVTSIGRLYIKVKLVSEDGKSSYGELQYEIKTGREKSEYMATYLYSSEKAFEAEMVNQRTWDAFRKVVYNVQPRSGIKADTIMKAAFNLGLSDHVKCELEKK